MCVFSFGGFVVRVLFVGVKGPFASTMVRSAIGRGGCEVYINAESLKNNIGVTMSALDTCNQWKIEACKQTQNS